MILKVKWKELHTRSVPSKTQSLGCGSTSQVQRQQADHEAGKICQQVSCIRHHRQAVRQYTTCTAQGVDDDDDGDDDDDDDDDDEMMMVVMTTMMTTMIVNDDDQMMMLRKMMMTMLLLTN
jgi:hypothetical protein